MNTARQERAAILKYLPGMENRRDAVWAFLKLGFEMKRGRRKGNLEKLLSQQAKTTTTTPQGRRS